MPTIPALAVPAPSARAPRSRLGLAWRLGGVLTALVALVFTAAMVAILWTDPTFPSPPDTSPAALAASGIDFSQPYAAAPRDVAMRDGTTIHLQQVAALAAPRTTVVLVHGVLGSGFLLNRASGLLRAAFGDATTEVLAIDLRGHGASGGAPGDVDYVGQYEDDLIDLVRAIRAEDPGRRVVLAGHSMGGGVVLRTFARQDVPRIDGVVLLAPYLGWSSPTTRKTATPEAAAAGGAFLRVHLPRILGLKLLNLAGVTAFNGLRVQFFNLPREMPLSSYSYRATEDQGPVDAVAALARVPAPILCVVGERDEAFLASAYPPLFAHTPRAEVVLLPGVGHERVTTDAGTMAAVHAWAAKL